MSNFEAVIFDMDGVILDSERMVVKAWHDVAKRHNIPNIEEHCREALGLNVAATRVAFERRYGTIYPYDQLRKEKKEFFVNAFNNNEVDLKPGIIELLEFLKKNNIKTAVASSTSRPIVEEELEFKGVLKYFDVVKGGDMVKRSKPDPEIFLMALDDLGVDASRTFGIEDSFNGVRALKAAGIHTIMVPDMAEPDDEMRNLSDVILPSLVEVRTYIEERL